MTDTDPRQQVYEILMRYFGAEKSTCEDAFNDILRVLGAPPHEHLDRMLEEYIVNYGEPEGSSLGDVNTVTMRAVLLAALRPYWSPHERFGMSAEED